MPNLFKASDVVMYIVVDRFGLPSLSYRQIFPVELWNPISYHGGSWENITFALKTGYFSALGVTVLIISTPQMLHSKRPFVAGFPSSPYYGYEPISLTQPEPRFGTRKTLRDLVAAAHNEGIKIILDSVHHMHYTAPEYIKHPERFSGDVGFPHLRKRNLRNIQAVDATWRGFESWLNAESDEVKPDGLRTDSQHELILKNGGGDELRYLKRLHSVGPLSQCLSIAEVLRGNFALWYAHVSTGCSALYNYPLYYALYRALACSIDRQYVDDDGNEFGDLNALAEMAKRLQDKQLAQRCLNFIDNHDMARFLSYVYDANQPDGPEVAKQRLLMTLAILFTLPGIVHLTYGTEAGMMGRGWEDPTGSNRPTLNLELKDEFPYVEAIKAFADVRKHYAALNSHSSGYVTLWQPNDNPEQIWSYGRIPVEGACIASVVNNCEHSVALENLVGGGIPTQGHLHSGTLVNVLDSAGSLEVTDNGLIVGTVPAITTLIVRNA